MRTLRCCCVCPRQLFPAVIAGGATGGVDTVLRRCNTLSSMQPPMPPIPRKEINAQGINENFGPAVEQMRQKMLAPSGASDVRDIRKTLPIVGRASIAGTKYTVDRSTVFDTWRHECPSPVGWHMSKLGCATCKMATYKEDAAEALQLQIIKGCNVFEVDGAGTDEQYEEVNVAMKETLEAFDLDRSGFIFVVRFGFMRQKKSNKETLGEAKINNAAATRNRMQPIFDRFKASSFPSLQLQSGYVFDEMTDAQFDSINLRRINSTLALALTPSWIEGAISSVGMHMRLETIDVLLLEGIEYLYDGRPEEEIEEEILRLFSYCEAQAGKNVLQYYGVASPNFAPGVPRVDPKLPPDAKVPEKLKKPRRAHNVVNLYKIMAIAQRAGGKNHRMRFVQYPMNLTEHQAASAILPYDGNHTLQSLCKALQLTTLGSTPIHTTDLQGHPQRYHNFPMDTDLRGLRMNFFAALERAVLKEMEVQSAFDTAPASLPKKEEIFIASLYVTVQRQLANTFHFGEWLDKRLLPEFRRALGKMREASTGDMKEWCNAYETLVVDALRLRKRLFDHKHGKTAHTMNMYIDVKSPTLGQCPILSQKAINFATHGCDVVNSGFHLARYFHEATEMNPGKNGALVIPRAELEALYNCPEISFANTNPPDPYMLEVSPTTGKFSKQKSKSLETSIAIDATDPKFPDILQEVTTPVGNPPGAKV